LNQIAYLAGKFSLLNQLNISLQGHNSSIIDLYDKIKYFHMKVDLWLSKLKGKKTYMFPILAAGLEESNSGTGLSESFISEIKVHLLCLEEELSRYVPDISNKLFPLVKSPFTFDIDEITEISQELIEIINDTASNLSFLPFQKHNFVVEGSWITQHLQKLFLKFFYHSQQHMSVK
jgi:hypothetical protein